MRAEIPDWLAASARRWPKREALRAKGRAWTYDELDGEATRMAQWLASLGVRAGDRVATLLPNGFEAAVLPHATLRLGAWLVPLNTRLTRAELDWQIAHASPRVVLDRVDLLHDETPAELRTSHAADDMFAVIYTSGTTSRPKGAMLTVGNFLASAQASAKNLGVRADDRWLAVLPLFHVGGLSIVLRSAIYGTSAVVHERFDAAAVNRAIDTEGVTIVSFVSVMLQRLLDDRGDRPFPSSFRCALVGGGRVPIALLERCARAGVPVVQTYGLTECASQVATLSPADALRRLGSAGRPLEGTELRITSSDDSGEGEILVRGPTVMAGYLDDPAATARAIEDGWLHTGDIGRVDEDGYLYVLDRRDDLIVTGGENVYPAEVESVLLENPAVLEAAVIGVPDAAWGQRVVAIVRLEAAASRDIAGALREYCAGRVAAYKIPKEIRVAQEPLPRTASGKILRANLRSRWELRL